MKVLAQAVFALYRALFAFPRLAMFNQLLLQCSLRGLGLLNYENARVSGELHLIERLLPRLVVGDEPVFLDVGANVGSHARMLRRRFPKATIHAFEPHPRTYERLVTAVSPSVRCHNIALGAEAGTLPLFDRADSDGSSHASLYQGAITEMRHQGVVETTVRVDTLDAVAAAEGLEQIDYLKIDTEGHELAVLRGAAALLERGAVGCLCFEFNEMNVLSRSFFRDFRETLADHVLYRLLPRGLLKLDDTPLMTELYAFQNILAVPRRKTRLLGI